MIAAEHRLPGLSVGAVPALRRLAVEIDGLATWNHGSEAVYLDAGAELQRLHKRMGIVRNAVRGSIEALASPDVVGIEQRLGEAGLAADAIRSLVDDRSQRLGELSDAITLASEASGAVSLIFRLLDYVVLVARTHVEGMATAREELVPFTEHVGELVATGQRISRELDERMRLLRSYFDESRDIERRVGRLGQSGDESMPLAIRALVARLATGREEAAEMREAVHASFSTVRDATGRLVANLQFHDIARQRMEHSVDNLRRLMLLTSGGGLFHDQAPLSPREASLAVRRIAELEIAQLEDLARVYEEEMGSVQHNLVTIGAEVRTSDRLMRGLAGDGQNGAIAILQAEASHIEAMILREETGRRQLDESLSRCVEAAGTLIAMTDELSELEHTLSLAGFNAAVRAAHVDSGDETIGFISREIREQAAHAKAEAAQVREGIERSVASTEDLGGRILQEIGRNEGEVRQSFATAAEILRAVEAVCDEQLRQATTNAAGLAETVARLADSMTPHIEGCNRMRRTMAILEGLLAEFPDEEMTPEESDRLRDLLAGNYTMVEERRIFERVFGGAMLSTAPAAPEASGDVDLDDILF
ncbi:hypothetical protein ASG48_05865 [Aurantimonas sp. Leaf443]|nr:hypothetical protein ASG48_05865 [Aurantimonas sp. Leaf443]